jgi:hypothetical protein
MFSNNSYSNKNKKSKESIEDKDPLININNLVLPFSISQPIRVSEPITPIKRTKMISLLNKYPSAKIIALKRSAITLSIT